MPKKKKAVVRKLPKVSVEAAREALAVKHGDDGPEVLSKEALLAYESYGSSELQGIIGGEY